jgi:lipopolysaccharide export system permease protein
MGRLNRYILKNAALSIGGLIIFACCVLLLERLLRIFEIVTISSNPGGDASRMVVNLLPYYLGIAVPIALLLGTIITVDKLSKSSELTAALGAGVSLFHMTKPFILISIFLAGITMFVEGYLQPVGRYQYRATEFKIKQTSATAALREGTFTTLGSRTFFAGTEGSDGATGPIFIHEEVDQQSDNAKSQSGYRITTANVGKITVVENSPTLNLSESRGFHVMNGVMSGQASAEKTSITGVVEVEKYKARGEDEREMTSGELFANRKGDVTQVIDKNTNNATLHLRLSKAALLLILPFIAVPFGLNYGRNPSSAGLFVGIVFLISLQKALEFGQTLGAAGKIPPWLGIWGIIIAVSIFAAIIFWKSAYKMGQPPLTAFSQWIGHMKTEILTSIRNVTKKTRAAPHA